MAPLLRKSRPPRGLGLIELMIAAVILIVAVIGFMGAMREVVNATAVAHRRTESALLRTGLMDRLMVSRRTWLDPPLGPAPGWITESCYDVDARPVADNSALWNPAFACPPAALYRRRISVTPVPDAGGQPQRVWRVSLYVERTDQGCTPATRYQSVGCVAADMLLTD